MLSVVIPVRDNARGLADCLASIVRQEGAPPFEILVVDDGSEAPVVLKTLPSFSDIRVFRQSRLGVSAARNLGWHEARGTATLFVDSDCVIEEGVIARLARALDEYPEDAAFQPWLVGDARDEVGRIEGLRVETVQRASLDPDGHIRYANTAGLVVRRSAIPPPEYPFDPGVVRGEDTLLLQRLLSDHPGPRSLADARVTHRPALSVAAFVIKHARVGYLSGAARVRLRLTGRQSVPSVDRCRVLREIRESIASAGVPVHTAALALTCYAVELIGRLAYRLAGVRPGLIDLFGISVSVVTDREVVARIRGAIANRRGITVSFADRRTLRIASVDAQARVALNAFDLVCAAGAFVHLVALVRRGRRIWRFSPQDFEASFAREAALRRWRVAFVGATPRSAARVAAQFRDLASELDVVLVVDARAAPQLDDRVLDRLVATQPDAAIVAMAQPHQELWVLEARVRCPGTSFVCVGELPEVVSARTAESPLFARPTDVQGIDDQPSPSPRSGPADVATTSAESEVEV